jgi:hypothetical protein
VVAVVASLASGLEQVGSGYLVGSRLVLTAEHCTRDKISGERPRSLRVVRASDGQMVEATVRAASPYVDVAVLDVADPPWADEFPPVLYGRVDRTRSGELRGCEAIGYPLWQLDPSDQQRNTAELRGKIRRTEGAEERYLVLRDETLATVAVPPTANVSDAAEPRSAWGGLSGALVFHAGTAIGVVVRHNRRQGASAVRLIPFDRIAAGADEETRSVALVLGISSAGALRLVEADDAEGVWRGIGAGRDIVAQFVVTGDRNMFYVGRYQRLAEAYIPATEVFERVDVDGFVGREWLEAELDGFLTRQKCGYFIVEAEAGLGKTAFLAHLVRTRGWIHHFAETAPGDTGVVASRLSLAAQLIRAYELAGADGSGATVAEGPAERPDYLATLLRQAAERRNPGEQIVVAIDGLDRAGTRSGENVLGLPRLLPDGVFIVCSQRPIPVRLMIEAPRRVCRLDAQSEQNLADMRAFLADAVRRPAIMAARLAAGMDEDELTETLLSRSRGLWLYLHFVLAEWGSGTRSPDLSALPDGLWRWYHDFFERWREQHPAEWDDLHLPVLATLAAIREPVSAPLLGALAGVQVPTSLLGGWRPLLTVRRDPQRSYQLYHQSLVDFLEGRFQADELTEQDFADDLASATLIAHRRIADRYLGLWGGLDARLPGLREPVSRSADDGYGLRHLVAHLAIADRDDELTLLLNMAWQRSRDDEWTENGWFAAHDAAGDIPGFLSDLVIASHRAQEASQSQMEKSLPAAGIALELRYALIASSIRDLAATVPAPLVTALVRSRVWSAAVAVTLGRQVDDPLLRYQQLAALADELSGPDQLSAATDALAAARELADPGRRAHALAGIAAKLPPADRAPILDEVVEVARVVAMGSMFEPVQELVELVGEVPEPHRSAVVDLAVETAHACDEDEVQAEAIAALARYLPGPRAEELLSVVRDNDDPVGRAIALAALAQRLPDGGRPAIQSEALGLAQHVEDPAERVRALTGILELLPEGDRQSSLAEAVAAIDEIHDTLDRVLSLGIDNPAPERRRPR